MDLTNTIAIIGAGIGGLTAALALLRQGLDIDVYEQSPELVEIGAGIQISANGTRVPYALGLETALHGIEVLPSRRQIRHWSTGETWDWFEWARSRGSATARPDVTLHRADLHQMLADAVRRMKPDAIHLGKRCAGVTPLEEHAVVRFDTGGNGACRVCHRRGRDSLEGSRMSVWSGSARFYRGCRVARDRADGMPSLTSVANGRNGQTGSGPSGHVLHYPIRRGELMNFISLVERDDWQVEFWTVVGTAERARRGLSGLAPGRPRHHSSDQDAFQMGVDGARADAAMVKGTHHLAWRRLPSGSALPRAGGVTAIEDAYVVAACLKKYFD